MSNEAEEAARRRTAIAEYRKKLLNHKELESRVHTGHRNKTLMLITTELGISCLVKKQCLFHYFLIIHFKEMKQICE